METKRRWQDGVGLLLGSWLLFSPLLGPGNVTGPAAWDGGLFGLMILARSALALAQPWRRDERVDMFIGLWLIAAPFVLGFSSHHVASLSHILIGLIIAADVLMTSRPTEHARGI